MNDIIKIIREEFEKLNKPKFIITVGISGSGKSTWINRYISEHPDTIVVSPDDIRRELTGSISDQSKNNEVFPLAFDRTIKALNSGKNVIFDATNISSFYRKQMLDELKNKVDVEFIPQAKIFTVDPEVAKKRIQKDINNGVDRANVPPEIIDRQYKQFKQDLNKLENDGFKIIK